MNKKLVFFFASALAVAGCAKEPQADNSAVSDASDAIFSLIASSDVFTKTELQGTTILWNKGDQIGVWENGTANSNVPFDLHESSVGSSTGLFKGELTPASENFQLYSIYPYNAEYGDDHTALSLTIPATVDQATDINALIGDTDFMIGQATSENLDSENGGYKMSFTHPLAFIKFVIDGSDCIYQQATIKSLTMTANVAFVGPVSVNLEDGTVTSAATEQEGKTLVVNFPATAKMNTEQVAWVAINPVDLSDAGCKFALEMTNGQKVTFTVNPNKMNGQALYEFQFKDIDDKIASGKGVPTYVDLIGMNGGARANCYIVSEGGYYRFAAQHVDKENVFAGDNPFTTGYRADWLWATGTETRVDGVGMGDSGNINFRVKPNSNGNTIIALYNPDKKIVWSWHIWCSTENPMTPHHYGRSADWLMSDRNLGATSNEEGKVESYGLMYQWGRKDPFPGPGILGSITASKESTIYQDMTQSYRFNPNQSITGFNSVQNISTTTEGDIAYSVAHPTTNIHYNTAGNVGASNTWLYSIAQSDALLLWRSNGVDKSGKTNYDPCPPGYIVPVNNYGWNSPADNPIWTNNIIWETNGLSGFNYNQSETNKTYYPAVGYRSAGQLRNAGFACYYWTGDAFMDSGALVARGLGCETRSKINVGTKLQTQFALPIRCMKQ